MDKQSESLRLVLAGLGGREEISSGQASCTLLSPLAELLTLHPQQGKRRCG